MPQLGLGLSTAKNSQLRLAVVISNAYQTRVQDAGGTVVAKNCLIATINKLLS